MRGYTTPPKDTYNRLILTSMPRQGDWICFSCNNLNFAFRKKCNRCKSTTREQNQQYPGYYYVYQTHSAPNCTQQPLHDITNRKLSIDVTPPKRRSQDPEKQDICSTKLPSVSPLVKRYQSGHLKKQSECEGGENLKNIYSQPLQWDYKWDISFQEGLGDPEQLQIIDSDLEEMVTRIVI